MAFNDWVTFGIRNEWSWLFRSTYGTTFTFWCFSVERDRMCNSLDVEFILMGLGFWSCIALGEPSPELRTVVKEAVEKITEAQP